MEVYKVRTPRALYTTNADGFKVSQGVLSLYYKDRIVRVWAPGHWIEVLCLNMDDTDTDERIKKD